MRKAEYLELLNNNPTKTLPMFIYPLARTLGMNPYEVTSNWEKQVEVIKLINDLFDFGFAFTVMDLTLEAEAFGCELKYDMINLPILGSKVIESVSEAKDFIIPSFQFGRIGENLKAIKNVKPILEDKPLIASIIGPFTLASILLGIEETKEYIQYNTEIVFETLVKVSMFLKRYALALIEAGADGIFIVEPMVDKLSSIENDQFSVAFINDILTVLDDEVFTIYHNCGDTSNKLESIKSINCDMYHFGEVTDLDSVFNTFLEDKFIMGNLSPIDIFNNGSRFKLERATSKLLKRYKDKKNFIISTGCDLPATVEYSKINSYLTVLEKFKK